MIADARFYFRLLSRRFPAMAALFLLAAGIGAVMALRLPTYYQTKATLLVEAAQIASESSRNGISSNQQLDLLQRKLLTRANLISIARASKVFPNQANMDPDDVVNEMRTRASIRRSGGRDRVTIMTISFQGDNPRIVADVVNRFVTIALTENTDLRTQRAEGRLDFYQQEVDTLADNLDEQSAKIVSFKEQNADALPENLEYRLRRQSMLQERMTRAEREVENLLSQRVNIEKIYETTGTIQETAEVQLTPEQRRLQQLETELDVALGVYSEQNPKVRLIRSRIEVLKDQLVKAPPLTAPETGGDRQAQVSALDVSLSEIDLQISNLREEVSSSETELEALDESIARTPSIRIALEAMERDMGNTRSLYSGAVQRLAQARTGERIELSAKGEKIILLEPPSVPNAPAGPNRTKVALMGVGAGFFLAVGLFVLLELINTAIRRPADIVSRFNITPLSSLPRFETAADRRKRRLVQVGMLTVVIIAVPVGLWAVDAYYMPLDRLFGNIIERLT